MTEYDFTNVVRELALKNNILDCKLEHQYGSGKGDGYLGTVKAVRLVGTNKALDIIFKFSHRNRKAHENVPLHEVYLREIKFYTEIGPAFTKFQEECYVKDPFNHMVKFYTSVDEPFNELLVLENLKASNYDMWDRKRLMNKEHLDFVFNIFGKFHATSYAMQTINPTLYNEITKGLENDVVRQMYEKLSYDSLLKDAIGQLLSIFDPITEKSYRDQMEKFRENLTDEFASSFTYDENNIILQGDCWCNNVMFQYEDMNDRIKPKSMKLLDYQMVRLGSPAFDLSFFFYTIAPQDGIDNLEHYLKVYHNSLTAHLKEFGLDAQEIFSYETFWKHWQNVCKYGLCLALVVRKALLMDDQGAPDIADEIDGFMDSFKLTPDEEKAYHQQIKGVLKHFIDKKFI